MTQDKTEKKRVLTLFFSIFVQNFALLLEVTNILSIFWCILFKCLVLNFYTAFMIITLIQYI